MPIVVDYRRRRPPPKRGRKLGYVVSASFLIIGVVLIALDLENTNTTQEPALRVATTANETKTTASQKEDVSKHTAIASTYHLPLTEVIDWDGRPIPSATAVVMDINGKIIDFAYITEGRPEKGLPWRPDYILKIAWGHITATDIQKGNILWIYDSSDPHDTAQLGMPTSPKLKTWAMPLRIAVKQPDGTPMSQCLVLIRDSYTGGRIYTSHRECDKNGNVEIVIPPGNFHLAIYDTQSGAALHMEPITIVKTPTPPRLEITIQLAAEIKAISSA